MLNTLWSITALQTICNFQLQFWSLYHSGEVISTFVATKLLGLGPFKTHSHDFSIILKNILNILSNTENRGFSNLDRLDQFVLLFILSKTMRFLNLQFKAIKIVNLTHYMTISITIVHCQHNPHYPWNISHHIYWRKELQVLFKSGLSKNVNFIQ